jgi:hypothetical protein
MNVTIMPLNIVTVPTVLEQKLFGTAITYKRGGFRVTCQCGASHDYKLQSSAIAARELHLRGDRCQVNPQTGKPRSTDGGSL